MHRKHFISFTATAAAVAALGKFRLHESAPPEGINFASLLDEMCPPSALAKWPAIEWQNRQASALKTDERHNPGQFANKAIGNFVRIDDKGNGSKEWVLMEHEGPGAIVRMWAPNMAKDAIMRIYFDGSAKPSIEVNMMNFFYGDDFVKPPFAAIKARGGNVYLPIPFSKGCKITVNKNECGWAEPPDLFYIIQYRTYAPGTIAATFDKNKFSAYQSKLAVTAEALLHAKNNAPAATTGYTVEAGKTEEITLRSGGKAINYFAVKIDAQNMADALRSTIIKLSFDGKETVACPAGDFFGSGMGLNPFNDWMRTVQKDGTMICRWVMPYKNDAVLKFINTGNQTVHIKSSINYQTWNWDNSSMYFHSNWGYNRGIDNLPVPNFNFISIKGKGLYVGDTLNITSYSPKWWGEGPEKISVDGEQFPSQFGTGSEDYYGYAWGDRTIFDAPFHAQPRLPEGPEFTGTTVNTRIRSLDAIPFKSALHLDMEVLTQDTMINEFAELDYGVATYWYGFPETTGEWKR